MHIAPRLGRHSIDRPRLVSLLDRVAETGILLVSAGAGYGKTAALSSWARDLDDGVALAWVTCGEEHNDPRCLVDQLGAALHETIPDVHLDTLGDIADAVVESDTVVVVFDDVHHLGNPSVWSAMEDLLRRRPDNLRIVVCGRDEEGLPWHRLRAQGEVTEVHSDDLSFTPPEARALLTETFGVLDSDEVAGELLAATQGWATGLCLAGHALRHGATNVVDPVALGRHRYVRSYFDDELLTGLKDDHVRFLEVTSLLGRLDPELCDLLTDRSDSHALLEHFVEHNLFTEQTSIRPPVFRYHQLFAEYLRTRTDRMELATVTETLAIASRWYEEHGLPDPAIDAAVRSGDVERVELLIREASGPALRAGFPHTVARWLSALPQESLDANPDLALVLARSAGATGDLLAVGSGLAAVGEYIRTATTPVPPSLCLAHATLAFLFTLWTGDFDAAETDFERAEAIAMAHREELGHDIFGLDSSDLGAYRALLHLLSGDLDDAMRQAERTLTPGQLVHPTKDAVLAVGVRALAMAWRGEPKAAREAVEQCRAAAATFRGRTGGLLSLLVAGAWCADSGLAESDLARAGSIVDEAPLPLYRAVYLLAEARTGLRTGRWRAAETSLGEAHEIIAAMPSSRFLAVLDDDLRAEVAAAASDAVDTDLTERELVVFRQIAAGASRPEAAERLYLSINTVKTYLRSAYRKLGVTSREDAIERAHDLGLLDPPDSSRVPTGHRSRC
jgi:LuxR family maltose regulon positive regulatory protein